MSLPSEVIPFPRRSRGGGMPIAVRRPIFKLEWDKLLAEAMEKDTEARNEFGVTEIECDDDDDICMEGEETDTNKEMMEGEMPLNLCYKSSTMPILNIQDENLPNVMDLSTERKKLGSDCPRPNEPSIKQNACTLPNFQSLNLNQNPHCTNQVSVTNKNSHISNSSNNNNNNNNNNKINPLTAKNPENLENIENGSNKNISYSIKIQSHEQTKWQISHVTEKRSYSVIKEPQSVETPKKNIDLPVPDMHVTSEIQRKLQNQDANMEQQQQQQDFLISNMNNQEKEQVVSNLERSNITPQKPVINSYEMNNERYITQQRPVINSYEMNNERFVVPAAPPKLREPSRLLIINGKSYQVLAPLGKGGSSKVYLVLSKENGLLAVKCVKLSDVDESVKNNYLNEIQHLMKMQHSKHVIKLYDHQYLSSRKLLYAVMERGDTDLSRFLKDKASSDEGISPELILYYWTEMLLAVKSIHDNNIIHRDLKPANFLLVSGRLKLIDFGIASAIQSEQTSVLMDTQSGTFNYMSPEALLDLGSGEETILKIGRKTDVWSLGCILYYFLYKKTPYQEFVKPQHKMKAITDPKYLVKFPKIPGVPDVLIESCKRCLIHDKNKRASIEELLLLRNQPLLSPSEVLRKLKPILNNDDYEKAEKAILDDMM